MDRPVEETPSGLPYLLFELHADIGLGNRSIALELDGNTSMETAHDVPRFIQTRFSRIRAPKNWHYLRVTLGSRSNLDSVC